MVGSKWLQPDAPLDPEARLCPKQGLCGPHRSVSRKNLPQVGLAKDEHPDQALATHELIESHSGPAAKTRSAANGGAP
jgi:hypothetical protein